MTSHISEVFRGQWEAQCLAGPFGFGGSIFTPGKAALSCTVDDRRLPVLLGAQIRKGLSSRARL